MDNGIVMDTFAAVSRCSLLGQPKGVTEYTFSSVKLNVERTIRYYVFVWRTMEKNSFDSLELYGWIGWLFCFAPLCVCVCVTFITISNNTETFVLT